jgi:cytochrome c553
MKKGRAGDSRLKMKLSGLPGVVLGFLALAAAPAFAEPAGGLLTACVPCHGMDGIGRDAEIPNLAGQNEVYLLNQLRALRKGLRTHKEMLYMSRKMSDRDMQALAAYFASLPPR